tara:strand:- start:467 stop:751 length:285 start_codon:yes stop_codon:yes gene_type:complete
MSDTIEGANAVNQNVEFQGVSDPFFYEETGGGEQVYLAAVLPQVRDPTLIPFNSRALNPVKYPEQTKNGFHPILKNPNAYNYNNTDLYFQPENV